MTPDAESGGNTGPGCQEDPAHVRSVRTARGDEPGIPIAPDGAQERTDVLPRLFQIDGEANQVEKAKMAAMYDRHRIGD
mgnify:CR=1 FL=1